MISAFWFVLIAFNKLHFDNGFTGWLARNGWPTWFAGIVYLLGCCVAAKAAAAAVDFFRWLFEEWSFSEGRGTAIASLVVGALSFLVCPIVLAPTAIVCGAVSANKGNRVGWLGVSFGILGLVTLVLILTLCRF